MQKPEGSRFCHFQVLIFLCKNVRNTGKIKENFFLTFRPRIWLMAADSFSVHSETTFALCSFMYSIKAFRGFLICGFEFFSFFFNSISRLNNSVIKKLTRKKFEIFQFSLKFSIFYRSIIILIQNLNLRKPFKPRLNL